MNKPCPSQVVLAFVIERIHEGEYDAAVRLGFTWEEIRVLDGLSSRDLHYLFQLCPRFIALRIDIDHPQARVAITRLLEQQGLLETQQALLRAGAPRRLMGELYGWTASFYCQQRKFLALDAEFPRGGRPLNPPLEAEDSLLAHWDRRTDLPLAERYLDTARALGVSVRQVVRALSRRAQTERESEAARLVQMSTARRGFASARRR